MSEDLISKQTTIHTIMGQPPEPHYPSWYAEQIKALPSIQPERKTGHWIEKGVNADKTHNIVCSKCGEGYKTMGHAKSIATRAKWRFCPHCGAKMEAEERPVNSARR